MAFELSPDNPMGRQHIMKGVEMHNKLIVESTPYVDTHQAPVVTSLMVDVGVRPLSEAR